MQSFPTETLPVFSKLKPTDIQKTISAIIEDQRKRVIALLAQDTYTWDNLCAPLEDMNDELSKAWAPIGHMHATVETDELRKAYNDILPILTQFHTEISQNEKLFNAINSIDTGKLNAEQKKIIENDIRDFKLSGVNLPQDKKAIMAQLQQELSELTTKFSENLLDATHGFTLTISEEQTNGLPEQAKQLAKQEAEKRELDGYVLTLDFPSYMPAMKYLEDRELRRQMYEAFTTRASDRGPNAGKWDNTKIMPEILKARLKMAQLVGFDNYASYSLATKMAKEPEEVLGFLNDLVGKSKEQAEQEVKEVKAIAKKLDGLDDIEAWDMGYYSDKLKQEKYEFNQEDVRPYFPVDHALNGMFTIINKLYGLKIKRQEGVDTWHKDVSFFVIHDEHDELRGAFYVDLYAREHKRDGAWMDECLVRHRTDKKLQFPVAFLTCNFMPPVAGKPALLTHDDVITLFHEFGHCLHHMLTKVDLPSVSGINGVPWDAVEFPSQFLENFCWEKEGLDILSKHYETGEPLPQDLLNKMKAAKNFQTGMQMLRQLEFALFDFKLHLTFDPAEENQVQRVLDDVRETVSVVPTPTFNRFQNSFSHIFAGGYAAGYYSYKWAEVLAADAYGRFLEEGVLNEATGRSFMHEVLEVGGVKEPMDAFIAFRGRAPKVDALLEQSGIGVNAVTAS